MAEALRDGACPQLEELDLSKCTVTEKDMTILAQTLEERPACTNSLKRLKLRDCYLEHPHLMVLAGAFGRGACPYLEELDLSHNRLRSYAPRNLNAIDRLANAMESGALPNLKELDMTYSSIEREDVWGFSEAFLSRLIL